MELRKGVSLAMITESLHVCSYPTFCLLFLPCPPQKVQVELTVLDYDKLGKNEAIGRVAVGAAAGGGWPAALGRHAGQPPAAHCPVALTATP